MFLENNINKLTVCFVPRPLYSGCNTLRPAKKLVELTGGPALCTRGGKALAVDADGET